ncbi:hypothetical protein Tco_0570094, partial [Tanacetum coccineum]
ALANIQGSGWVGVVVGEGLLLSWDTFSLGCACLCGKNRKYEIETVVYAANLPDLAVSGEREGLCGAIKERALAVMRYLLRFMVIMGDIVVCLQFCFAISGGKFCAVFVLLLLCCGCGLGIMAGRVSLTLCLNCGSDPREEGSWEGGWSEKESDILVVRGGRRLFLQQSHLPLDGRNAGSGRLGTFRRRGGSWWLWWFDCQFAVDGRGAGGGRLGVARVGGVPFSLNPLNVNHLTIYVLV